MVPMTVNPTCKANAVCKMKGAPSQINGASQQYLPARKEESRSYFKSEHMPRIVAGLVSPGKM